MHIESSCLSIGDDTIVFRNDKKILTSVSIFSNVHEIKELFANGKSDKKEYTRVPDGKKVKHKPIKKTLFKNTMICFISMTRKVTCTLKILMVKKYSNMKSA